MKDLSEQMLLAKQASPVTDGLFFWLDGRDSISASNTFLNRVSNVYSTYLTGGNNFERIIDLTNVDGFYKIHFDFSKGSGADIWFRGESGNNAQTIELVTSTTFGAFIIPDAGGYWTRLQVIENYVRYVWGIDRYAQIPYNSAGSIPIHIVARPNKLTINGVHYKNLSNYNSVSFSDPAIIRCWESWGSPTNHTIGTLRAYSKELSDDEVLQNYNYEQSIGRVH